MPTRNRAVLLALTLRSVLAQRDVDFEVIVVDEASSDDTPSVITSFADPRIRSVRHDRPLGVSAARNRGVAEARADWVAFLDDDDLWAPTKLTLQLGALRASRATWAYVGHVNVNVHHHVTGGDPPLPPDELIRQLPQHNVVPGGCSGVMVSKDAVRRAGLFDVEFQPLADWELWLRLAHIGVPAWVSQPLVAYRLHGAQMSLDLSRVETEFWRLFARNRQANPAILLRYLGWWALRIKNHRAALRYFVRAWLQRRPNYRASALAGDLAALGRDVLAHRLRLSVPLGKSTAHTESEERSWRRAGQEWIDALIASHLAAGGRRIAD